MERAILKSDLTCYKGGAIKIILKKGSFVNLYTYDEILDKLGTKKIYKEEIIYINNVCMENEGTKMRFIFLSEDEYCYDENGETCYKGNWTPNGYLIDVVAVSEWKYEIIGSEQEKPKSANLYEIYDINAMKALSMLTISEGSPKTLKFSYKENSKVMQEDYYLKDSFTFKEGVLYGNHTTKGNISILDCDDYHANIFLKIIKGKAVKIQYVGNEDVNKEFTEPIEYQGVEDDGKNEPEIVSRETKDDTIPLSNKLFSIFVLIVVISNLVVSHDIMSFLMLFIGFRLIHMALCERK